MENVRWAVNFSAWKPTKTEWSKAIRCIQIEEKERINRFVYAKDSKASLIGRLLMRKLFVDKFGISNDCLKLGRNDRDKPYIMNELSSYPALSFNVSHQGSFTVLAAENRRPVGVDVMRIEYNRKSPSEFFKTMDRQFTDDEWSRILCGKDEREQLANFYRNWCLKESYVKAIGIGISLDLKRLNFVTKTIKLQQDVVTTDTVLKIDHCLASNWLFHETMLDMDHCVAVALGPQIKTALGAVDDDTQSPNFTQLKFDDVISSLEPIYPENLEDWETFKKKL